MANFRAFGEPNDVMQKYEDVLKSIETAVIRFYNEQPELTDAQVDRVYELLIRAFKADLRGSNAQPPLHQLNEMARELYARVRAACEWHLGKGDPPWKGAERAATRTPDVIIDCLKQLRKSVHFWTVESGRQGYLNYVKPYIR
ncbi:MAG: hypothetical protein IT323_11120 [Anaerolineae bacterium]|nr:hypothetical protein [Anaerolineae bacterium]